MECAFNAENHLRLEDIAIPLLFFPIGLLKFFGRAGLGDGFTIFITLNLTVICLFSFCVALFHSRTKVRLALFATCSAILLIGIVGWHWELRHLQARGSSAANLMLGTPDGD